MSDICKKLAGAGLAIGAFILCSYCPPVAALLDKLAELNAPSVWEMMDSEGVWPLF